MIARVTEGRETLAPLYAQHYPNFLLSHNCHVAFPLRFKLEVFSTTFTAFSLIIIIDGSLQFNRLTALRSANNLTGRKVHPGF